MKKSLVLLSMTLSIITTMLLMACESAADRRRSIIVLVDYSGTITEAVLQQYAKVISQTIFSQLDPYDRLVALPIDVGARTQPTKIIHEDLRQQSFERAGDGFTHAADSLARRKEQYLASRVDTINQAIIEHRGKRAALTHQTDIFSALQEVESLQETDSLSNQEFAWNYVQGKPSWQYENVLIIFSDMIHESGEYNFARNHSSEYFQQVLTDLADTGGIPSLRNTKVIIHGRTGENNEQVESLLVFWQEYFRLAGAELVAYEYDGRLWITQVLE